MDKLSVLSPLSSLPECIPNSEVSQGLLIEDEWGLLPLGYDCSNESSIPMSASKVGRILA
jgi:hypothetical protein